MRILIIGAGEVGSSLAQRLSQEAKDVVVIDENEARLRQLSERADVQTVQGSGSSPSVLVRAGLEEADLLIAVTDSDEVNLVACLIAQAAYPSTRKIARIRNPEYHERTGILAESFLGLDLAINPEREAAETIIKILGVPAGATDFAEFAEGRVRLVGFTIDAGSPFEGRPLSELPTLNPERNIVIAAIVRGADQVLVPKGDARPQAGDVVYAVTLADNVPELFRIAGKKAEKVRRVMVVGGSNIGAHLARHFAHEGLHVKLIESNEARAEELAERLRGVLVVQGDGTDRGFLLQQGIASCDAFVGATADEEDNILMSLLAKREGAERVIPVVNRTAYAPIVSALGVD
ncbi:MAG: Trk system potassium transporter TrkA, partial [Candidatus Methylomirabilis sp.]|nr:Trk system potassium transporter TrkA [Deltaproteobacteria bacterium]